MSLIISSYDKNLKNNRIDSNTDNIHDHFYNKLLIKPKLMYEKEPEIYKYKMDKITCTKPNYDKYDMNINLYPKFKNENIKLYENDNVDASKKYDNVDESLVKNKLPSAYYQYKLKDINSSKMLLNNLETNADIQNELNLLRLNEQTGYTIPELKRDNIDRQNALDLVLSNYLNKKNDYTSKTTDETKEKDKEYKDKKISRINNTPYFTKPSLLNKKIIINPAIIPTPTANVEDKIITNIERKRQKENETDTEFLKRINKKNITKKTKKNNPIVNTIVNPIVNPIVNQNTEPLIESDIIYKSNEIEENKTTKNPMIKSRLSHSERRKQKANETDYDYEQRIITLDKSKNTRKIKKEERNILSKKLEEDYNKRLTALIPDSNKISIHKYPIAGTKTPN